MLELLENLKSNILDLKLSKPLEDSFIQIVNELSEQIIRLEFKLKSFAEKGRSATKLLSNIIEELNEKKLYIEKINKKLNKQKAEIHKQAKNLAKTNIEITLQKDKIQRSHNNITASINYAQRIQNAVLPTEELITSLFPQHFILFKPCDIVSGDFYFIKSYKNQIYIVAADCTGHGVPGAFMSMLGVALLNEIVRKPEIQNAAQMLDELRTQVKNSLQQTGQKDEQQDGMDIAFAEINIENKLLSFAGANNSMLLFRDSEMIELKADRMPVGVYLKEQSFTNHEIFLKSGDVLYLYTDGYYSQFRETTQETMKIKRFKQLLKEIHTLNFDIQKQRLDDYLNEWKGNEAQVDDILIIGLKI